jgi:mannosyltransferase
MYSNVRRSGLLSGGIDGRIAWQNCFPEGEHASMTGALLHTRGASVLPDIDPWKARGYLSGLIVLAAILRLYRLDGQALWLDEMASLRNALAFGEGGIRRLVEVDQVAPLHSILLWYVMKVGGDGTFVLRLPSVVAGVLAVPAVYWVVLRMFGTRQVALIAAGLIAISPFAIWYAQEARMYSVLLLCATAFVALSWAAVTRRLMIAEMLALTAMTAIGFYTHQYMVMLTVSFGLFLVLRGGARGIVPILRSAQFWQWAATQIAASMIFAFWLALTLHQAGNAAGLAKPAILLWTPYTLFTFVTGLSYGPSVTELHTNVGAALRHHVIAILVAVLAIVAMGLSGVTAAFHRREDRAAALWLVLWLTLPMALAILATFATRIQYNVRYVIICYPALMILLAFGISRAATVGRELIGWPLRIAATALVGCMLLALSNWYYNPAYAKEDLRALAHLLAPAPADTLVVSDNGRLGLVLTHYGAILPQEPFGPDDAIPGHGVHDVLHNLARKEKASLPREIWLVGFRSWEIDHEGAIRKWIEQRATLASEQHWPGVSLRRYRVKTRPVDERGTTTPN